MTIHVYTSFAVVVFPPKNPHKTYSLSTRICHCATCCCTCINIHIEVKKINYKHIIESLCIPFSLFHTEKKTTCCDNNYPRSRSVCV